MPIRDYLTLDDDIMILEAIGDEGIVLNGVNIPGIVSYDTQNIVNQEAYFVSPQITLTCLKKDMPPKAKRGTKFSHGDRKLLLDELIQDTETHHMWICKDANAC